MVKRYKQKGRKDRSYKSILVNVFSFEICAHLALNVTQISTHSNTGSSFSEELE